MMDSGLESCTGWSFKEGNHQVALRVMRYLFGAQVMEEELPEFTIPGILSHLEVEDICKCACISRSWASWVHGGSIATRVGVCGDRNRQQHLIHRMCVLFLPYLYSCSPSGCALVYKRAPNFASTGFNVPRVTCTAMYLNLLLDSAAKEVLLVHNHKAKCGVLVDDCLGIHSCGCDCTGCEWFLPLKMPGA